ncbi:hypothetical protein ACFQ9Z_15860 [Streptomyces sp. NPDC056580]|uniref:hypothetical protein n=1 Tax=Streptomyces sp. NPDC056580 TaxID=3345872 RepID=UPI0036774FCC
MLLVLEPGPLGLRLGGDGALPALGTCSNPDKGDAQSDILITSPERPYALIGQLVTL